MGSFRPNQWCGPDQEDLCLMAEDGEGVLRFVSGAVLFPQRWSLLEKLGMDMQVPLGYRV